MIMQYDCGDAVWLVLVAFIWKSKVYYRSIIGPSETSLYNLIFPERGGTDEEKFERRLHDLRSSLGWASFS